MAAELDTITKQLLADNKALSDLVDYLAGKNAWLRESLQNIANKNPFHNQCPPINNVQFYSQVIVEMVGIARAALKEKE